MSHADLKAWQDQDKKTHDLLHAALRTALKERFKLALHGQPAQRPIMELVIAKRGPRLKSTAPDAVLPVGVHLPSGGVITGIGAGRAGGMEFHGATMQDLAYRMLYMFGSVGPVRDRTGLTGRHDFRVLQVSAPDEDAGFGYSVSDLGLEFKRGTENRPILVIDHLERPTPN